jgi:hypothetical protein
MKEIGKKGVKVIKYTQLLPYREAQDLEMGPKKAHCKGIDLAIYLLILFLSVLYFFFFFLGLCFMVADVRVYLDYLKVRDLMRIVIAFDKDYITLI